MSYNFVSNFKDDNSKIPGYSGYYQIAYYMNPETDLYHVRKFLIDDNNNIVNVTNVGLTKKQYKKFIKMISINQYKQYPVYSLDMVEYPTTSDFLVSKSTILNNNFSYSGYSPF